MKKLLVPALLAMMLAACSSTPDEGAALDDGSGVTTVNANDPSGAGIAALTDPNNILSQRSVYFDYDSYSVKSEFAQLMQAHAAFLNQHPEMRMMIQGNTDERGSPEYNLALGQKRAEAVRQALVALGANGAQIEAVSLGEEKPRCYESYESCYAENRRGDMLYQGEF